MMQFIFYIFSLLVLITSHVLLWYIFIRLFNVSAFSTQLLVAIIILFLFLSVLAATYLSSKWNNWFTRGFYIFSGLWVGILINLGVVIALILLLKLLGLIFIISIPYWLIKLIFWGGVSLLSAFGIYCALSIKITEYEVRIKDLPQAWNNKIVVQLSDVHLGPVYQKKFFYRLIKKINTLRPEAVFITGDLFDGTEADFAWLNHPFTKLQAPKGVYYSFGNHDLYLGFNRVIKLLRENPVKILDNKMVVVEGLQIIGINYSFNNSPHLEAEVLKQVNYDPNKPSILLLHAPRNIPVAKKANIDLQLSGHTHDGQLWPFNYIAKWMHQGYGYGFFKVGNFSLIVNSGAGTWGPPMRTTTRSEIVKIVLKRS